MYRILRADRDAYITDRIVQSERVVSGNVGAAGTLDLFKLYGLAVSGSLSLPLAELSRLLIHFDLDPLRDLVTDGKVDLSNPSFNVTLKLFDVFGGQPTPSNFTITLHPLSRSFDEGLGRDVVYYGDHDVCNFLSGSREQGPWILSGANQGGHITGSVDYITTAIIDGVTSSVELTQLFTTGEEDLEVDVTTIVSATLAGDLPDEGFRIALTSSLEEDTRSYFVKRFASRTAFDDSFHPQMIVRFDDSIQDDSLNLTMDSSGTLFLYNYAQGTLTNLLSASTDITGSNSLLLRLETAISGGFYDLVFTGSQHNLGDTAVAGLYSASVYIPSTDATIAAKFATSGSVIFTPIWGSLDGTVPYLTGSRLTVYQPTRGNVNTGPKRLMVSVTGLQPSHDVDEEVALRVEIMDRTSPRVIAVKTPVVLPGEVMRDVHYQVRDAETGTTVVPFDTVWNSTRVSSDGRGMFFTLDTSSLTDGHSYVIDVMITQNNVQQVYRAASPVFRVHALP